MLEFTKIDYPGFGEFSFSSFSDVLRWRANSFLTKEPTTLEWLQGLGRDSILIDVGANVGIYTIPAALFHVKKVIAIEPEIQNYQILLKNIEANKISNDMIEALPLAVSTEFANTITKIFLTIDEAGHGCHQVGRNQNHLLEKTNDTNRKSRSVYCISLSTLITQVTSSHTGPIHIKIDVDGIEEDVCQSLFEDRAINRISSLQVELNPSLKNHSNVIQSLAMAGFYYSESQYQRSVRKSGPFKGFAEIVFKRSLSKASVSSLPASFAKFLGPGYSPTIPKRDKLPVSGFVTFSTSKIAPLSRQPASFVLKNMINYKLCAEAFHRVAEEMLQNDMVPFDFADSKGSYSSKEKLLRHSIKNSVLDKIVPGYLHELRNQVTSRGLFSNIKLAFNSAAHNVFPGDYLEGLKQAETKSSRIFEDRLVVRIRHFLDLQGFCLGRHHDSVDTYCALVIPLIPYSTSTSIMVGGFYDRSFNAMDLSSLRSTGFGDTKFKSSMPSNSIGSYVEFSRVDESPKLTKSLPLLMQGSCLQPGDAFVIPNIRSIALGNLSDKTTSHILHHTKCNGHGVAPGVVEPYRPILLIDYLLLGRNQTQQSTEISQYIDIGSIGELCVPLD